MIEATIGFLGLSIIYIAWEVSKSQKKFNSLLSKYELLSDQMNYIHKHAVYEEHLELLQSDIIEQMASEIARLEEMIHAVQKQVTDEVSLCNKARDSQRICSKNSKGKKAAAKSKKEES
ncbi:MAG: hypothetical protein R6V36_08705 [Psychroflexus sp.]